MYLGSEQHKVNVRIAKKASIKKIKELAFLREQEYNKAPKFCKQCSLPLPYKKHNQKNFCNSSCSAAYSNKLRGSRSLITKDKIRISLNKTRSKWSESQKEDFKNRFKTTRPTKQIVSSWSIDYKNCIICNNLFVVWYRTKAKKTCSKDCRTHASIGLRPYQNGSRKPEWYFNKWENKKVLLESSWEIKVAKELDKLDIFWIRPKPLKWIDSKNKEHLYYPDFYLPKQDIFLDPKNPYCMEKDKEKMKIVSAKYSIIYGSLNKIIDFLSIPCSTQKQQKVVIQI